MDALTTNVGAGQEDTTITRNVDASTIRRKVLDWDDGAVSAILVQTTTVGCGHADVLSSKSIPVEVLSVGNDQASGFRFVSDGPSSRNANVSKAT